jgi:O-antigen ligase
MPHFHNTYLEILVQFGAIGFILLAALLAFLARGVRVRYRAGGVPGDLPRLFLVTLVFVLLWNFTNFRVPRHDWMAFWILFAGGAYSLVLRKIIAADPRTSQVDPGEAPGNRI